MAGGIGMVLLSEHEDQEVRELYAGTDIPQFPGGIEHLLAKLAEARRLKMRRHDLICYGSALLDADPDGLCFTA